LLDRKSALLKSTPYFPCKTESMAEGLRRFVAKHAPGKTVAQVSRLPGGGSKEQFAFELQSSTGTSTRHVVRMDPFQSAVETDRLREFEIHRAFKGVVPVPDVQWVDPLGQELGRPCLIMSFVGGVTKPSAKKGGNVSGMGTAFTPELRATLAEQFVDHLAAIHLSDWRAMRIPSFQAPSQDSLQAARWQLNWWARVWRDDGVHPLPMSAVVEQWLHDNLPGCDSPVLVHADYRNGNFLFDEATGEIRAILDWELAHLGDFHEDLAWVLQRALGTMEDGRFFVCGLIPEEEFLERYASKTGFAIDARVLRFYEVLVRYKNMVLTLATCIRAAQWHHNHQDAHATYVAAAGHLFHSELCRMMQEEYVGR
jgi:aminoglycoside phosphotransferase (APT) family kinase protein